MLAGGCISLPPLPEIPTPKVLAKREAQTVALAQICERRGQPEEAVHMYNKLLEKNPKHALAHHRLAVMSSADGKFAEADEHFGAAWQYGPHSPELYNDMGYRLYLEGRFDESEKMYRDALALKSNFPACWNNLGLVIGLQGRYQESLAAFRQVNSEAESESNFAYVLAQHGKLAAAQAHYNKALSLNPDLKPAAKAMIQLAERERNQQATHSPQNGALATVVPEAPIEPVRQRQPSYMAMQPPPAQAGVMGALASPDSAAGSLSNDAFANAMGATTPPVAAPETGWPVQNVSPLNMPAVVSPVYAPTASYPPPAGDSNVLTSHAETLPAPGVTYPWGANQPAGSARITQVRPVAQ